MISIVFKRDSVEAYFFDNVGTKSNEFKLVERLVFGLSTACFFNQEGSLAEFLKQEFSAEKYKHEKFYVLLDGFNIQYRTQLLNLAEIAEEVDDKKQIEEEILSRARATLPEEISSVYPNLVTSILSCCDLLDGELITSAHIPQDDFQIFKDAFRESDLGLMMISSKAYGLFNALGVTREVLIVSDDNYVAAMNNRGLYVWARTAGMGYDAIAEKDFIREEVTNHLDEDPKEFVNLDEDFIILRYLRGSLDIGKERLTKDLVSAFGIVLPRKELSIDYEESISDMKKGGGSSVSNKLRQLFNI